jgi:hypothetical protein
MRSALSNDVSGPEFEFPIERDKIATVPTPQIENSVYVGGNGKLQKAIFGNVRRIVIVVLETNDEPFIKEISDIRLEFAEKVTHGFVAADLSCAILHDAQISLKLTALLERLAREIGALAGDPFDAFCVRGGHAGSIPRRPCAAGRQRIVGNT